MTIASYISAIDSLDEYVTVLKVFEEVDGLPRFLKNGHNGSRKMPLDQILYATQKQVRDGSGGQYYKSGFHVFFINSEIEAWRESLKIVSGRVIVPIYVGMMRSKPNSRFKMYLADSLYLPSHFWQKRVPISLFSEEVR